MVAGENESSSSVPQRPFPVADAGAAAIVKYVLENATLQLQCKYCIAIQAKSKYIFNVMDQTIASGSHLAPSDALTLQRPKGSVDIRFFYLTSVFFCAKGPSFGRLDVPFRIFSKLVNLRRKTFTYEVKAPPTPKESCPAALLIDQYTFDVSPNAHITVTGLKSFVTQCVCYKRLTSIRYAVLFL